MTWVEIVRLVAIAFAFAMPAAFCTCYHLWTAGHWKDSVYGVHLMVVSGVDGMIMLFVLLAALDVIPQSWRPYAGSVIYFSVGAMFLWRLILLARDHRRVDNGETRIGRP